MKKRTPLYLAILGAFVLIFVEIARYSYINRDLMRQENVSHLQSSYAQVARTFALFAERNWKLLDEWDTDMPNQLYDLTSEEAWSIIRDKAARWQYNDLYMFNQNGEYSSLNGRHGISSDGKSAFLDIYRENQPVLTSYRSPDGARKVVFAKPIHTPVLMEGTTYTGLAVTYRNDALEQTISVSLYDGASDCYMVKSDGTVVLSLESQTEFDGLADNMLDFVDGALAVSRSEKAEMRADIAEGQSGSLVGRLAGEEYYIVYQPSGMEDWSIVGVVRASVVEAGARKMQADTISLATLIASLTMLGVSWLILGNMKAEAEYRKMEQQTLARQKDLSDRLFTGMGRIVDRYTVCDLAYDRYEYHENVLSKPLYPETGRYRDLVELMSRRYLVLGRAEGMKIDQTLDPDYLRRVLRKETDILKFEYCIREKNVYALLNIIPIAFDGDGLPTQVMMIGQDIGQKVELENLANTDGLTGLFNERYFSHVLADQEKRKLPFALYYLDLDFFKPINDTYGHDMGDKLLKAVAKRLQTCIRSHDFAFRIGGDEFAVVYRADLTEAQRREKQALIVDTLTRPYEIDGKRLQIGASCGYAHYPEDSAAAADIRILADQRMYAEKEINHQKSGGGVKERRRSWMGAPLGGLHSFHRLRNSFHRLITPSTACGRSPSLEEGGLGGSRAFSKPRIQLRVQGRNPARFKGGYGVPRGFKGEKSKSPPNPLGLAERVYSFHRLRAVPPPSKREVFGEGDSGVGGMSAGARCAPLQRCGKLQL